MIGFPDYVKVAQKSLVDEGGNRDDGGCTPICRFLRMRIGSDWEFRAVNASRTRTWSSPGTYLSPIPRFQFPRISDLHNLQTRTRASVFAEYDDHLVSLPVGTSGFGPVVTSLLLTSPNGIHSFT